MLCESNFCNIVHLITGITIMHYIVEICNQSPVKCSHIHFFLLVNHILKDLLHRLYRERNAPVKLFCPHPPVCDKKGGALEKRVIRVFI